MALVKFKQRCVTKIFLLAVIIIHWWGPNVSLGLTLTQNSDANKASRLQNSDRCRIPVFRLMSTAARKAYQKLPPLKCQKQKPLTRVNGTTLFIDPDAVSLYSSSGGDDLECCFSYIYRKEQSIRAFNRNADNQIEFGPCMPLETAVKLTTDFVQVKCKKDEWNVYLNVHAVITPRPAKHTSTRSVATGPEDLELRPSVMIIGADSLSRLNFQRQLPRTFRMVEDLGFIQYFEYNKVADNTFPNLIASLAGRFPDELNCCKGKTGSMDDAPLIIKNFRQQGYVTFYAEDSPQMATFSSHSAGFVVPPTDYYYKPFSQAFRNMPKFNGYCFGFENEAEPLFDYTYEFMYHHRKRPYFGVSWGCQLTHNVFNQAQYGDPIYYNLFEKLNATQILNNTIVFFVSDHGLRVGDFRKTYQGRFEERLPAFFVSFPPWFKRKFPQAIANFRTNAYRLTSNFDFYQTLRSLINVGQLDDHSLATMDSADGLRGQSLFKEVSYTRTCQQAGINDHWCTCVGHDTSTPDASESVKIAFLVLKYVNKLISAVPQCSTLVLQGISNVELDIVENGRVVDMRYVVRIVTRPGNALLETTVRYDQTLKEYSIVGDVSRLNLYRNQSWCVDNPSLRLICYCKIQKV